MKDKRQWRDAAIDLALLIVGVAALATWVWLQAPQLFYGGS